MIVQHSTLGARYCIPRHALGPSDRSRISAALTIVPPATEFGPSAPKPITYYEENEQGDLLVPRFYGVKTFGTPHNTSGVQDAAACRRPNLGHFQGTLDESRFQRTAVARVENALRSSSSGGGAMLCVDAQWLRAPLKKLTPPELYPSRLQRHMPWLGVARQTQI